MMLLLAETVDGVWRPGIGDPTVMGWVTVAAYFATAWLCWRARLRLLAKSASSDVRRERLIWTLLAALFIALGVNKQLDLQSWFTMVGRSIARQEGWYGQRRVVQAIFIAALAVTGAAAMAWLAWMVRGRWRTQGLAAIGAAFIVCFVIIRAASFHHVDEMLGWTILHLNMNWILELGGIACVAACAVRRRPDGERNAPSKPRTAGVARADVTPAPSVSFAEWMNRGRGTGN